MMISMKLWPANTLMGAFVFLVLSCGSVDYAKKYPNMIANVEPFSVGKGEAQFERFMSSKLNKVEINVVFHPRLNAVALEFRYELFTHRQFWDEKARQQFAAALERYKVDYAERKLVNKPRRTRAVYGKAQGRCEWEAFRYTKTRVAFPVISLGYRFRNDLPFFVTWMRSAPEYDDTNDNSARGESPQIAMYFTRAQADILVKLFDQQYLLSSLESYDGSQSDEPSKGLFGIDWSNIRRRDSSSSSSRSKEPVVGDPYGEYEEIEEVDEPAKVDEPVKVNEPVKVDEPEKVDEHVENNEDMEIDEYVENEGAQ